jgi:hypothetical protein
VDVVLDQPFILISIQDIHVERVAQTQACIQLEFKQTLPQCNALENQQDLNFSNLKYMLEKSTINKRSSLVGCPETSKV